jgi:hypothetical protein
MDGGALNPLIGPEQGLPSITNRNLPSNRLKLCCHHLETTGINRWNLVVLCRGCASVFLRWRWGDGGRPAYQFCHAGARSHLPHIPTRSTIAPTLAIWVPPVHPTVSFFLLFLRVFNLDLCFNLTYLTCHYL